MFNLSNIEEKLSKKILPMASKFGSNKVIQAISAGLMYTLPLTLGASLFSILASFPIPSVNQWFQKVGLTPHFSAIMGGTLNIIALLISISIAYSYVKNENESDTSPVMGAFLSVATFIILMPQTIDVNGKPHAALDASYLGSSGMFVAIILGIIIAKLYVSLCKNKKLLFNLPEGVPPMVSQSFKPLIVSLIILVIVFFIRVGIGFTSFKDIFSVANVFIGQPLMKLGGTAPALIIISLVANSLFFFGIHPNAILSAITPLLLTMAIGNVEAYQAGIALPYKTPMVVNSFINNDGVGSTLSLIIAILIFCKSKRYKAFAKISAVPNIFNINEPIIFGLPIMLNAVLFIPFILSTLITSMIGYIGSSTGFINYYNPVIALALPWTTPKFISSFLVMGWRGLVLRLISIVVMVFVYLPFIKMLDNQAIKEESENKETAEN